MPITTSYFAVANRLNGTKVSVARFHHPRIRGSIDEVMDSFAPSPELLGRYKKGRISWLGYIEKYTKEQREHFKESPDDFEDLLHRAEEENIILLCYERFEGPKTKCHRFLLYDILKKVAKSKEYDVEFIDEEPPRNRR